MNTDRITLAALASLPGMGPARLRWLTAQYRPSDALEKLRKGSLNSVASGKVPKGINQKLLLRWRNASRQLCIESLAQKYDECGVSILLPQDNAWPFHDDIEPPSLLFYKGAIELLASSRKVAVIGTRRCSSVGRKMAYLLGEAFATANVTTVSGLALGVDGASHKGALAAGGRVLAVVGTGLDVIYPKKNASLWRDVEEKGLLISENPLGAKPEKWRFPARNRLLAGLSAGVVVVESHAKGGSLLTVDEALARDKSVMVVPGSALNAAAIGSNALLKDGAVPVCEASDVYTELGWAMTHKKVVPEAVHAGTLASATSGITRSELASRILGEVGAGDVHMDSLVMSLGLPVHMVMAQVQQLVVAGDLRCDGSTLCLP